MTTIYADCLSSKHSVCLASIRLTVLMSSALLLAACASTPTPQADSPWMQEILNYESSLAPDHKDSVENLFTIPEQVSSLVKRKFGKYRKETGALKLAKWLVDRDGKKMQYDVDANFTPNETFQENRGNCLSFTLLLIQLADEIGISLHINEVDLPNTWGQNEAKDLIFYRHVNAIHKSALQTLVFDLAMDEYGKGYPQRYISKRQGASLLYSNKGIQHLLNHEYDRALHFLKLAVSIGPNNSDVWINLGVALNRTNYPKRAEQAYLYAVALNDRDSIAASNLERLYRSQSRHYLAEKYKKLAHRARQKNPYVLFQNANEAFANKEYRKAKKAIKRAIRLHDKDPQFFAFRSKLRQIDKQPHCVTSKKPITYQSRKKNELTTPARLML